MMSSMDPALAGFLGGLLGGLVPSAVAIPIARYQVRAARKRSDGAMYAEYIDTTLRFASLLEDLANLKAERRRQIRRREDLASTQNPGASTQDQLEDLVDDMEETEQAYRQLLGRVDERSDALGLIRRKMTALESENLGHLRDEIDVRLVDFHDLCVRGDPLPTPEEIRQSRHDLEQLGHDFLEASREDR